MVKEETVEREKIMEQWDYWRERISKGDKSSAPRDWFESVMSHYECRIEELELQIKFLKCGYGLEKKQKSDFQIRRYKKLKRKKRRERANV